jgi:hypothetical protein
MEEKKFESAEKSTESQSLEKKDYHAPGLTVYGDMRELTMTNLGTGRDTSLESTLV